MYRVNQTYVLRSHSHGWHWYRNWILIHVDYEGVVVNAGLASLYDARIFNIGLAIGVDQLVDANRSQWLYQQKPWFGVLFGLNLN